LSVIGACIKVLITNMDAGNHLTVQWLFCVSAATILCMIVGIAKIMKEEEEDRSYIRPVSGLLIAAGIIILAVPLFGYPDTLAFLFIIAVILFVPVFVGIRNRVRYKFFTRK
jgi:hypothetical protein